jgi:hypothetical protein
MTTSEERPGTSPPSSFLSPHSLPSLSCPGYGDNGVIAINIRQFLSRRKTKTTLSPASQERKDENSRSLLSLSLLQSSPSSLLFITIPCHVISSIVSALPSLLFPYTLTPLLLLSPPSSFLRAPSS